MVANIKRIWRLVKYFWHAKKAFSYPKKSDVIIFDAMGEVRLREYFKEWCPEILYVRGEQINIPILWSSLFRKGKKTEAYIDSFIEKVNPKLIVTYIDNDARFYTISIRHPKLKTIFIQNGWRDNYTGFELLRSRSLKNSLMKVDYILVFSELIGLEYGQYIQGQVVPIGSLANNKINITKSNNMNLIAFVSQYGNFKNIMLGDRLYSREVFSEEPEYLVLTFLIEYAKKHGKKLVIIPRYQGESNQFLKEESDYYEKLLGQKIGFLGGDGIYSSYEAVDLASVVVGIDSTLAYEAAARGKRTAIFSIRSQIEGGLESYTYGWPGVYPDEGPYWTNIASTLAFEKILNHLFAITQEEWKIELEKNGYNKLMMHDPGNEILRSILQKEMG